MTVAATFNKPTRSLRARLVPWPHEGFTTELLRLFLMDAHSHAHYTAMGIDRESLAAFQVASLDDMRGVLFVAEDGTRLQGLLFVEPEIWGSAYLHRYIWSMRHLVVAPDASLDTAEVLVNKALELLDDPVDLLVAEVPATNGTVLRGLHRSGFRVIACEAVGIVDPQAESGYRPPGVSIVPMRSVHLPQAAGIAASCCGQYGYSTDAGFDSSSLERLYGCLLGLRMDGADGVAVVAENNAGEVLGLVSYRRETEVGEYTPLRTANLDILGVRPDWQSNGLGEILLRHALSLLGRERIGAVITKFNASNPASWNSPVILRRLGFRIAASNLILHKRSERGLTLSRDIGYFEDSNRELPDWRTGAIG